MYVKNTKNIKALQDTGYLREFDTLEDNPTKLHC